VEPHAWVHFSGNAASIQPHMAKGLAQAPESAKQPEDEKDDQHEPAPDCLSQEADRVCPPMARGSRWRAFDYIDPAAEARTELFFI
jgi:hypothetical protein